MLHTVTLSSKRRNEHDDEYNRRWCDGTMFTRARTHEDDKSTSLLPPPPPRTMSFHDCLTVQRAVGRRCKAKAASLHRKSRLKERKKTTKQQQQQPLTTGRHSPPSRTLTDITAQVHGREIKQMCDGTVHMTQYRLLYKWILLLATEITW